jgi:hypothetical protein
MQKSVNPNLLSKVINLAQTSLMNQKHGAILFSKNHIYAEGINNNRTRLARRNIPSVHAEMDCMNRGLGSKASSLTPPTKKKCYLKGKCKREKEI